MEISTEKLIERIKTKISPQELESLGFSPQVISNWKSRNSIPKADDLFKLAQFCGCSMEYLLTGQKTEDDDIFLTAHEQKLLHDFKLLDPDQQKTVLMITEALSGKTE